MLQCDGVGCWCCWYLMWTMWPPGTMSTCETDMLLACVYGLQQKCKNGKLYVNMTSVTSVVSGEMMAEVRFMTASVLCISCYTISQSSQLTHFGALSLAGWHQCGGPTAIVDSLPCQLSDNPVPLLGMPGSCCSGTDATSPSEAPGWYPVV